MKKTLLPLVILICLYNLNFAQTSSFVIHDTPLITTGNNPYVIDSGHLNAGLYPDIVVGTLAGNTVEIYINNEDGTFASPIIKSLSQVNGIHIADLDGINGNDVLASSYDGDKLVWYANNGNGTFADEATIVSGVDGPGTIVTGMIDAGSTLDIALAVYGNGNLGDTDRVIWLANDGSWTASDVFPATAGLGPGDIDIADVDGDTDLDIVVANTDAGTVELYYNNYNPLTDNDPVSFTESAGGDISTGNAYLFDISFADIDDDLDIDILKVDLDAPGEIACYKNSSGIFTEDIISNTHPYPSKVFAIDFNNDTYTDIVAVDGLNANDDVFWFESDDMGNLGTETPVTDNNVHNQIYSFTMADFDNDGNIDLATIGFQDGTLKWIENQLDLLSIEDNLFNSLSIYPNPTKDILNFKGNYSETLNVSVYDVLGKNILNKSVDINSTLDVSKLKSGLYILKFEDFNNTFKFIKE